MLNGNPHNTCGISCRVTLKRARDEEKVDFWGALADLREQINREKKERKEMEKCYKKTSEQLSEEMLEMQAQAGQREGEMRTEIREMRTEIRELQTRQSEQGEILRRVSRQVACIVGEASPELQYSNEWHLGDSLPVPPFNLENTSLAECG
eukprot:gb/GECG01011809.1/.p1 GENE.gb/GECG01011809.1/~~gb/GECG01011809.1/.p1  ORF type:complete len:151 (+),score=29.46 gb/GECG01011809.1/:1-453(+)